MKTVTALEVSLPSSLPIGWLHWGSLKYIALTSTLSLSTSLVQTITGSLLGTVVQCSVNTGLGLILAFRRGWELTLVVVAFVPLIAIGGWIQVRILSSFSERNKRSHDKAGQFACEAISNIRTVMSLTRERTVMRKYKRNLRAPYRNSMKKALISAIAFGLSQAIIYYAVSYSGKCLEFLFVAGGLTSLF
jgi:ABC-type bacteriocin/lantibiotic exporter with double-glycine peptidase domain